MHSRKCGRAQCSSFSQSVSMRDFSLSVSVSLSLSLSLSLSDQSEGESCIHESVGVLSVPHSVSQSACVIIILIVSVLFKLQP